MRTDIVIDEKLVDSCRKFTGIKTKRDLVDHALHELLRCEKQKKLLELQGKVDWQGDLSQWREQRRPM